jgi:iron complex outermembrane receptor protein
MPVSSYVKYILLSVVCALSTMASAEQFNIPAGDLKTGLDAYAAQTGISLMYVNSMLRGARTNGVKGNLSPDQSLVELLRGTGFVMRRDTTGAIGIERAASSAMERALHEAAAPAAQVSGASLETVTVTSSKIGGDVQNIPIAITALSQEQLTATQTAGGPDLIKQVPNMTFTKTNFSGYSIQIRGIGTQAISVTTDPAVAVAFNDVPFIRNHFFEQEFYDVSSVEVLRGPQGTLYGRNATAGVVNLASAKPSDQFEAMASADFGNYQNRRFEGMLNVPVVDDRLDLRMAGEWTKRDGYSFNDVSDRPIDGRDLWSTRVTLGWKPDADVQTNLIWEHFSEDDDRLRSSKQLCTPTPVPTQFEGYPLSNEIIGEEGDWISQGCSDASLYSPAAFGVIDGRTLPFWTGLQGTISGLTEDTNPYAGTTQSTNLRVISSELDPSYKAKNDTVEFNADWHLSPMLTFTSQTGYNHDFLWSAEDYNRFATIPDAYNLSLTGEIGTVGLDPGVDAGNDTFCDPQLGCSSRLEAEDLSDEHAWQLSQEFRFASSFNGPLNFSVGGNYLHYETEENYYVFINALTLITLFNVNAQYQNYVFDNGKAPPAYVPGVFDNTWCLTQPHQITQGGGGVLQCSYIDPNPITHLNNEGHNYFLSQNPYVLNSYAGFGEAYYQVLPDLKLTAGLRWTDDQKHFTNIPSEVVTPGYGYLVSGVTNQQWDALTGRFVANWTPDLSFTDKTLVYGSISHGYKAGGANPPGAELVTYSFGDIANPVHPATFKPEYIEAFELGTKNTVLDGALTLNADAFYYNYTGYQISEIVDRTAINLNFNARVKGAELEANWEPIPGLRLNLAQGFEDARLASGSQAVDLMDRTAGNPNWIVVRPFVTQASNCVLPDYVVAEMVKPNTPVNSSSALTFACGVAYSQHFDPNTNAPYVQNPTTGNAGGTFTDGYPGFDPLTVDPNAPTNVNNGLGLPPNSGQGFDKNLSGNELPNAPHFTTSIGGEYTMPLSNVWAATLHADFYWQSQQWARVFEDPIDRIKPYSTTNLLLIFTNQNGWQVMGYVKNVFNVTAITGTFLNSDDTDLTTNIFLTDPRLIGVRVTKNW